MWPSTPLVRVSIWQFFAQSCMDDASFQSLFPVESASELRPSRGPFLLTGLLSCFIPFKVLLHFLSILPKLLLIVLKLCMQLVEPCTPVPILLVVAPLSSRTVEPMASCSVLVVVLMKALMSCLRLPYSWVSSIFHPYFLVAFRWHPVKRGLLPAVCPSLLLLFLASDGLLLTQCCVKSIQRLLGVPPPTQRFGVCSCCHPRVESHCSKRC